MIYFLLIECNTDIINPGPNVNTRGRGSFSDLAENNISVVNLNIRSIRNKIDWLQTFVDETDIVTITESHLDDTVTSENIKLDSFSLPLRKDRSNMGGGLLIYTKEDVICTPKPEFQNDIDETLWAEICCKGVKFLLCCTYRPEWTRVQYWERLNNAISLAYETNENIVICGDMNCDLNKVNNNKLIDTMTLFNLTNVIDKPTRVTPQISTLLDPIIISDTMNVILSDVYDIPREISDHDAAVVHLNVKPFPIKNTSVKCGYMKT